MAVNASAGWRRRGLVLAVGTTIAAIAGTQWPFEYRLTRYAIREQWRTIDWSWFPRTPMGTVKIDHDLFINLAMLMPVGLGYALWRRAGRWRTMGEVAAIGLLLGTALEAAQLATRDRYPSFADLWRNALGCVAGGWIAIKLGPWIQRSGETRQARA